MYRLSVSVSAVHTSNGTPPPVRAPRGRSQLRASQGALGAMFLATVACSHHEPDRAAQRASARAALGQAGASAPSSLTMAYPRQGATATLLSNGKVLLAGGTVLGSGAAEIFDPQTGVFSLSANMNDSRRGHTATLLQSGKVLLVGGAPASCSASLPSDASACGALSTAEIYDPIRERFDLVGSMSAPRVGHTATLQSTGEVVISGGGDTSEEQFDPNTGQFSPSAVTALFVLDAGPTPPPVPARAAVLPSGKILFPDPSGSSLYDPTNASSRGVGCAGLIARRVPSGQVALAGPSVVSLYDPTSETCTTTPTDVAAPDTATLLPDGTILLTGETGSGGAVARIFEPSPGRSSPISTTSAPLAGQTATLLPDGDVLFAGGLDVTSGQAVARAEEFELETNAFLAKSLTKPRAFHSATVLTSDVSSDVLFVGGDASGTAELLTLVSATTSTFNLKTGRSHHTATLLPSGDVLVAGGVDQFGTPLSSVEIFDASATKFSPMADLARPRRDHAAVLLPEGKVLMIGGLGPGSTSGGIEIYDPSLTSNLGVAQPDVPSVPDHARVVSLSNGDVLVFGGSVPFRYTPTTRAVTALTGEVQNAFGVGGGLPDGLLACGAGGCDFRRRADSQGEAVPSALVEPGSLVTLPGGDFLVRGTTAAGAGDAFRYGRLLAGVVHPLLNGPSVVVAGDDVVLHGQRLTTPSAVGSQSSFPRPDIVPIVYFVPSTFAPIASPTHDWSDVSVSWRVPNTPYVGPGWLYAVVDGVPSNPVFVVLEPPRRLGLACSSKGQCASGFCSEGVCCNKECSGGCQSCVESHTGASDGQCENIPMGGTPRSGGCNPKACARSFDCPDPCRPTGLCNGAGDCQYPPEGTSCKRVNPFASALAAPDGVCLQGQCAIKDPAKCSTDPAAVVYADGGSVYCAPYACNGTTWVCGVKCFSNAECAPGFSCTSDKRCSACSSDGTAEHVPGIPDRDCDKYSCRNGECLTSCKTRADCQPWATCLDNQCVAACDDAGVNALVKGASGAEQKPCGAYRCQAGQCRDYCKSHADCAQGNRCGANGHCEIDRSLPQAAPDPGCACTTFGVRGSSSGWVWALGALAWTARRRRAGRRGFLGGVGRFPAKNRVVKLHLDARDGRPDNSNSHADL
jgi:hypothetical protein